MEPSYLIRAVNLEVTMTLAVSILVLAALQATLPAQQEIDSLKLGEWRLLGPLPKNAATGIHSPSVLVRRIQAGIPYSNLQQMHKGPEGMRIPWTQPDVASYLLAQDAKSSNPRSRISMDTGKLEIASLLPLVVADPDYAKDATAYLYLPVFANAKNTIPVQCGGEGTINLWWNGKPLLSHKRPRQFNPESFQLDLEVMPGLNHLLVQVENHGKGWSFEMQAKRRIDNPRIHRAIDLGVQYLLDRQSIDGSWPMHGGYTNGVSALAVYTLIKSGVSTQHESVLKGLEHLRQQRADKTYAIALELMAFHAGGDPQDDDRIEKLAGDLVDWQMGNGLWGYGSNTGGWHGDLSNAQYAALGLRAAAANGVRIPDRTWRELAKGTLACSSGNLSSAPVTSGKQVTPAGFGYSISTGSSVTASMTAAGVGTLAICRDHLIASANGSLLRKLDRSILAGIGWLGANWTLGNGIPNNWNFYYVYGLERAGGLAETETFGEHEWYWEGASLLVNLQKDSGGWGDIEQPVPDCFALLFLRRATGKQAITNITKGNPALLQTDPTDGKLHMRLSMRPPVSLWIDSTTEDFDDIVRVIYWMKPPAGDWIRVEEFHERRFAIQPALTQPGNWAIRADAVKQDGTILSSRTLEFEQKDGTTPERFAYVTEGEYNKAPAGSPRVTASSSLPLHPSKFLTDGRPETFWLCDSDDTAPFVDVRFKRPRKCESLKLVLAPVDPRQSPPTPKITLLEIQLDNDPPKVISLPGDLQQKAVLEFERTRKISRVRLRVLSLSNYRLGENVSIGLAEIELY